MTTTPRHRDVLALADLLYTAAADIGVRIDDVTLTPDAPGPEIVVRVDDPGPRARFATRIRMPHPEAFPPAPVAGRIETYTTTYLGIRVQLVGPMPDPLTSGPAVTGFFEAAAAANAAAGGR